MQQPIEIPDMSGAWVPVIQGGAKPISYPLCENYTIRDNPPTGNTVDNGWLALGGIILLLHPVYSSA